MLTASYAKINLFLEVCGKLPNNYHQVNTVFSSIDLFDTLSFELIPNQHIELSCSNPSLAGSDNLVYKIASHLMQTYHPTQGVRIHLDKHIPIAAGLGGGSSNAATTLLSLNNLWKLGLSDHELNQIAGSYGSDINFFLHGGCAIGTNRGELISPIASIEIPNILLVNPRIPIPSSLAYQLVQIPSPEKQKRFDLYNPYDTCFNRLETGIRQHFPKIDSLLRSISGFGAVVSMLSGSGSTCFGIFNNTIDLERCESHFINSGFWTHRTTTISSQQSLRTI